MEAHKVLRAESVNVQIKDANTWGQLMNKRMAQAPAINASLAGVAYWKCCEKWLPLRQPMKPHVMQIQRSSHAGLRSQPCSGASSVGDSGDGDGSAFGDLAAAPLLFELMLPLPVLAREFCLVAGTAQCCIQ